MVPIEAKNSVMAFPQPLPRIPPADEIIPAIDRIIARFQAARASILENVTVDNASFDTVMGPVTNVENETIGEIGVIWMLQYGAPDRATQDIFAQARQRFIKAEASWNSSDNMYTLLLAARNKAEPLDEESQLLLDKTLLQYKLAGCGITGQEQKQKFVQDSLDLDALLVRVQRNISQESGGVEFANEDLKDLPAHELDRFQKHQQSATTFVPFSNGGTDAVLTFASNPEIRKRMYIADQNKLQSNIPLMQDIVARRHELAERLGYRSHGERRMETRLLKSPAQVRQLLEQLTDGLMKRGRLELDLLQKTRLADLQKLDSNTGDKPNAGFPPWDLKYYQRLVRKERKIDEFLISEYFPLETAIPAMLRVFETAMGLQFVEIPKSEMSDSNLWHETVTVFGVWDTPRDDQNYVGYLYFDLLWREHKFRGGHNVTMEFGFEQSNGQRKYPSTIVMTAFPAAKDDGCVLLKHHQLLTLFHELGHAVHSLVSRTTYSRFHGTSLPPDFVEIPSLMLENWCWVPSMLQSMSTHYSYLRPEYREKWKRENPDTPDPSKQLPANLAHALAKHRYADAGLFYSQQLSISLFDLEIHSPKSAQAAKNLNVQKLWYDIRQKTEGLDFADVKATGSELVAFNHLVGGYDMAYYSYLCCSSLAQDLFESVFAADPMSVDAWARYRRTLLLPGGGRADLMQLLEDVLGHPPNTGALIKVLESANL
ncbi:peptidase family M3 [Cordyceps militaris]|uniref:Peptidase family M3 n=1 Tax=Cordyceps militaris TaxID=73501 RepID=A0A2H4SG99_CORMI|nr:peptidase family M3 [Cordyceps militaris]